MIALLLAAHLTNPEQFFCDDLYRETRTQCVQRTREWACSPNALAPDGHDRIAIMFRETVREERRLVCHKRSRK